MKNIKSFKNFFVNEDLNFNNQYKAKLGDGKTYDVKILNYVIGTDGKENKDFVDVRVLTGDSKGSKYKVPVGNIS